MNIILKNNKSTSENSQQIFRQFAWNLAGTLSKNSSNKVKKNSAKKRVGIRSKTTKKGNSK